MQWVPEVPSGEQPLFLRIAEALIRDVKQGRLAEGDRLPSTRQLATQLGVNRNTVIAAWRELCAQGWIEGRARSGMRVSARIASPSRSTRERRLDSPRRAGFALPEPTGSDLDYVPLPPGTLSLAGGRPDLRAFPVTEFARAWRTALRHSRGRLLEYGDPQGHLRLRQALSSLLAEERGLKAAASEIVVTRGSQQALYLLARTLLRPGDRVAVERLGYPPAWAALRDAGAELVPIDLDSDGLDLAQLERQARDPRLKMVYCTPHHQFPTLVTLSPSRRLGLLELARRHRLAIIEDDYDNEFHFHGRPVAPLASHDRWGVVLYVGTTSKVLAPGLRLGFLSAPPEVVAAVLRHRMAVDRQGDAATEVAIALLIEDGTVPRHLRRMRRIYASRQATAVAALRETLGDRISFEVPGGGLALWVHAPGIDVRAWQARALARGLAFEVGGRYDLLGQDLPYLRVGFASLDEGELAVAMEKLRDALEACFSTPEASS